MVLGHEYLHSFGIIDELQVRNMTYDLCRFMFGEDHLASRMSRCELWSLFPELRLFQNNTFEDNFQIVKKFDKTTQSYIC
jgi:hypothetical protein